MRILLDANYAVETRYVALCSVKGSRFHPEGYSQTEKEADAIADAWMEKQDRNTMGPTRNTTLVVPVPVLVHKKQPAEVLAVLFSNGLPGETGKFLGSAANLFEETLPIWPTAESVSSLVRNLNSSQ